jgi:hypothetical protein
MILCKAPYLSDESPLPKELRSPWVLDGYHFELGSIRGPDLGSQESASSSRDNNFYLHLPAPLSSVSSIGSFHPGVIIVRVSDVAEQNVR